MDTEMNDVNNKPFGKTVDDDLFFSNEEMEKEEEEIFEHEKQKQKESTDFFDSILGQLRSIEFTLVQQANAINMLVPGLSSNTLKKLNNALVFLCSDDKIQQNWVTFRSMHPDCCNDMEVIRLMIDTNFINELEARASLNDFLSCLHLPTTRELCFQTFCSPLLQPALRKISEQNNGQRIIVANGGGIYNVINLKKAAEKLGLKMNHHMNSDLDFYVNKESLSNSNIPRQFKPYIAIYELKTAPNIDAKIELPNHPDFSKIIVLLRGIVKSYAYQLRMHEDYFKKVRVWGILQYGTQIWFLRCSPIILPHDLTSEKLLVTYWITYYSFNIQSDTAQVCNMYYKILHDDARILYTLLQEFELTTVNKYISTIMASSKVFKRYEIIYSKNDATYQIMLKLIGRSYLPCAIISTERMNNDCNEFIETVQRTCDCNFVKFETVLPEHVFMLRQTYSELYILLQDQNSEIFLEKYAKQEQKDSELVVIFQCYSKELCAAIFSRAKPSDLQYNGQTMINDLLNDDVSIYNELQQASTFSNSSSSSSTNSTNSTSSNNSTSISNFYNTKSSSTNPINTIPRILSDKEWMDSALKKVFDLNSSLANFETVVHKDDGLFGKVKRNNSVHFVKISRSLRDVEAISVMHQLLLKQLYHNHILKIYDYKVYTYNRYLLTITESEVLEPFSIVMKQLDAHWIRDWFIPHVAIPSLDALEMLHSKSIIHGDVSLMNLMFRKQAEKYTAVWIDMNSVFDYNILSCPEKLRYRLLCGIGTVGFFPDHKKVANVFTDCYGVILVFCTLVYFGLFKAYFVLFDHKGKLQLKQLATMFTKQPMGTLCGEEQSFMKLLQLLFEKVVIDKDENCNVNELKQFFQLCLDKENVCPVSKQLESQEIVPHVPLQVPKANRG